MRKTIRFSLWTGLMIVCLLIARVNDAAAATIPVINLNDSGLGSLREAIVLANSSPGPDTIIFAVSGTINVQSQLPYLTDASGGTTIDGSTAPGYAGEPVVAVIGPGDDSIFYGLRLQSANNTLRALEVGRFYAGIWTAGLASSGNVIEGCYVGTDGVVAVPNSYGVVFTSPDNRLGTNGDGVADSAERNVVSGNLIGGVVTQTGPGGDGPQNGDRNIIAGNFIGTDKTGQLAIPNEDVGVYITGGEDNRIGTDGNGAGDIAERNIISGNSDGLTVTSSRSVRTIIAGNFVGTNVDGNAALGNTNTAVQVIDATVDTRVGTNSDGIGDTEERNVISGNGLPGLPGISRALSIGNSNGAVVAGNYIGPDATGNNVLGNIGIGVLLSCAGCTTGGRIGSNGDGINDPVERNVITGNSDAGIIAEGEVTILSNSVYNNGQLGIDINGNGRTLNDVSEADGVQNHPNLFSVSGSPGSIFVSGNLLSLPNTTFRIEFFSNTDKDLSGFGEGEHFLNAIQVTTDGSGWVDFSESLSSIPPGHQWITATATLPGTKTSEFSNAISSNPQAVTSLGPAAIWLGLKNSDDVGIRFDVRAEVYRNGTEQIGSGEITSVPGGSSGFNNAKLRTINLTAVSGAIIASGDSFSIKLLVRNACSGSGKNSGTARVWYGDSAANSHFDATIGSNSASYYLLPGLMLGTAPGSTRAFTDKAAGAKCSPYKEMGTWSIILP